MFSMKSFREKKFAFYELKFVIEKKYSFSRKVYLNFVSKNLKILQVYI